MKCQHMNAQGEPCNMAEDFVNADGLCPAHKPGGIERLKAASAKGGAALRDKLALPGFPAEWLTEIVTIADAQLRIVRGSDALLEERIDHKTADANTRSMKEWIVAERALITQRLEGELRDTLNAKDAEIASLRRQLGARGSQPPKLQVLQVAR